MSQFLYMAAALLTGVLVPLQLTFNAQLGQVTRNAISASFIVFLVGAWALAIVVLATRSPLPSSTALLEALPTVWLGGLIAMRYIVAIVVLRPRLGVGLTVGLILVGQLLAGLTLDHLGAFGNPRHLLNPWRIGGLAMMIAGVITIKMHWPREKR